MGVVQLKARIQAALQDKQWSIAAEALRQLLAIDFTARNLIELSYVESLLGHYRSAEAAVAAAVELPCQTRDDFIDLIARLRTFNRVTELRDVAARLLKDSSVAADLLASCAGQLSNMNEHAWALRCAERAVHLNSNSITARLSRGQICAYHGDMERATSDLEWCLQRNPRLAAAWWLLAQLSRQAPESNHVEILRRSIADSSNAVDVSYYAYALHKEFDDLGDVASAWQALQQACRAKRSTLKYSADESRALVDSLVTSKTQTHSPWAHPPTLTPVFVVGMHRSGTTLLEQILSGHPEVHGAGELYDFSSAMRYVTDHHCQGVIDQAIIERSKGIDFHEVGKRYLDGLAWRLKSEHVVTDKLPSNFLNTGFICQALPQAKLLHMVRDPVEVCFSNLRELFAGANPYSYDQIELADFYLEYLKLMEHWHRTFPGRILDVHYGRLVADPETTISEICTFVGLDYQPEMLDIGNSKRAVSTASAVQVRSGIIRREMPKWKPYEQYLQPMINRLREGGALQGWGY